MPKGIGYASRPSIKPKRAKKDTSTTGFAGNFAAPIDTAGMDPEMKRSLTNRKRAASNSPLAKLLKKFGVNL